MHISCRALLRFLPAFALSLCALTVFVLAAPQCAAAVGPIISGVTNSPNPVLAKGGYVTVTAKVTDSTAALSSVTLYEDNRPGYYNPGRTAPMGVPVGQVAYSATILVDLNSNSGANGENLYIVAIDSAGNRATYNVATQGYDNTAPTIANVTSNPITIPARGATVTVTAKVEDGGVGLKSVVLYENNRPGYYNPGRTAPMGVPVGQTAYSAAILVDLNGSSGANGENLYIVAIDNAGNQATYNVATQGYDNVAPSITNVAFSPNPIPVEGANVTVTAKVEDGGVGLKSVVLYENNRPGYYNPGRTAPMGVPVGQTTYSANMPVDLNSNTGANGENLYIIAVDNAGNQTTYNVATQGYSSVPATGSMPILITADPSKPVLSPAAVPAGSAETTLTLNGNNFAAGATVLFNGVTLVPNCVLLKQISVNVPASLLAQPGSFAVSVLNPSPSVVSNSVNLNVLTAEDVTGQVALDYLGQRFDRASGSYLRSYRLTNTGRRVLPGTLSLVADQLTNARLTNAAGVTHYKKPAGSPFVQVAAADLAPGASATATLALAATGTGAVTYTPRILAGIGAR